jgi:amidohydrolase
MDLENHPLVHWLSEVRRDFHMHPELGLKEFRTTSRIKEILDGLGVKIQELPGVEAGVLGVIEGQPGDKTLALRADIDALPMTELNDVPYKSTLDGVMHSCGHDGHATVMLGVAKKVMESGLVNQIKGTLKFIFQPAEEILAGARLMIDAGVLEKPHVDRIMACHMFSDLPVGQVGLFKGVSHASADTFRLTIQGKGVHGAYPHAGVDPIVAGASFVNSVQTIVSRNIEPVNAAVVTVGQFHAGTATNIIPDSALLSGTVRTFKKEDRDTIVRRLEMIAKSLEQSHEVTVDFQFIDGVPPSLTDRDVSEDLRKAAAKVLGEENVHWLEPKMGGEDFALFSQLVPATFMRLGCQNEERGIIHKGHSPYFDMDEAALAVGVEVFTEAARSYLS